MVREALVGDIHDNLKVFSSLEAILAKDKVDRIMYAGDFSDGIDPRRLMAIMSEARNDPAAAGVIAEHEAVIKDLRAKYETPAATQKMTEEEQNKFVETKMKVDELLVPYEASERYAPINDAIGRVNKKLNVKSYGVAGNHDDVFIYQHLKNVDLIDNSQSLAGEKVVGARRSLEGCEGHSDTHGRFFIQPDDDDNLDNSHVYQAFKDKPIELLLTHKSCTVGELAKRDLMPRGKGLAALAKKNGFVEYCGHFHGNPEGWVYRDPETKVLSLNPGTSHMMVVSRKGKKVQNVKIYALGYNAAKTAA